jgi:hypothetical protein
MTSGERLVCLGRAGIGAAERIRTSDPRITNANRLIPFRPRTSHLGLFYWGFCKLAMTADPPNFACSCAVRWQFRWQILGLAGRALVIGMKAENLRPGAGERHGHGVASGLSNNITRIPEWPSWSQAALLAYSRASSSLSNGPTTQESSAPRGERLSSTRTHFRFRRAGAFIWAPHLRQIF